MTPRIRTVTSGFFCIFNVSGMPESPKLMPPDATGGSIATVTNFGTFGLTWATPIPLPEQTLVLGMGAGRVVPSWDAGKGQFLPVTEANVTLSFDHRVLDGGAAGRLLARIATLMGAPQDL